MSEVPPPEMISDGSSLPPEPASLPRTAHRLRYLRWLGIVASLGLFAAAFNPEQNQVLVDGLWILALGLWASEVQSRSCGRLLAAHWCRRDLVPIAGILVVFVVAWLPFYNNWRWAYTADSLSWFTFANDAALGRISRNLLSVHGVDGHFTYIHSLASNSLMFIFEPSLLWHRVGKLIVSCLSLAIIYAYFTLILGRWWAAAVVVTTAANYVWLWFSYVSYGHIDSHIFYFLTLVLATLVWRDPEHLAYWMLFGLVGGCALFFTQTSWSVVAAAGLVLSSFALLTRRFVPAVVYMVSFLLAAMPILLQLQDFLNMAVQQARSVFVGDYLVRIFATILSLPYDWNYCRIGVQGAFLRWPLGTLYLVGLAVAGLAIAPPVRRALRVPNVAMLLLALLLWDAVLLTLTNNANPQPSTKRVYNLIPVQAFFGLLPLYLLCAWSRDRPRMRWLNIAVTVAVIGVYAVANVRLLVSPVPRVYGYNVSDAMIELRQRFPDRHVRLFSSRNDLGEMLGPESLVNELYHVQDTVTINPVLTAMELQQACAAHALICYEPNFDTADFTNMIRTAKPCLQPLPLLNTLEAACFNCDTATCRTPVTDADISGMLPVRGEAMYATSCH